MRLIEGVPGTAKTLTVKTLSRIINASFSRIQFTPDLMPSDITGTNVFNIATSNFNLRRGPVFTDILLADEINRTPPKTQAALLEAMEERQVTIDGDCLSAAPIFTVLATENPIEYEGTYPLPEAQLDRFQLKILLDYPKRGARARSMARWNAGFQFKAVGPGRYTTAFRSACDHSLPREVARARWNRACSVTRSIWCVARARIRSFITARVRERQCAFALFESAGRDSRSRVCHSRRRARCCSSGDASSFDVAC
jgi:hypothetical protein